MKIRIISFMLIWTIATILPSHATFGGFRVGGMFGVQLLQGRHWYTGQPSPDTDMVKRLGALSSLYGIHGGYLFELGSSKIVVGGEVYAISLQANPTINLALLNRSQEGTVSINHTRSLGIALTVGMMLNPKILAYLNAGMENAKFQFKYSFSSVVTPAQQIYNHTFKAINVAVGGAYKFGSHFLVGLELASPFFKRFKIHMNGSRAYHYKPAERRAMLKLTYLF
jgi:opacity protein-like surface antigen